MNISEFIETIGISVLLVISLCVSYSAIRYGIKTYKDYGVWYLLLFSIINFMFVLAPVLILFLAVSNGIMYLLSTIFITSIMLLLLIKTISK